jgi:hypothetical protein
VEGKRDRKIPGGAELIEQLLQKFGKLSGHGRVLIYPRDAVFQGLQASFGAPRRLLRDPRMPRCCQFWEDRKEPSAGLMGLQGPHLPASRGATDKLGDAARAENWRNPGVRTCVGFSAVS